VIAKRQPFICDHFAEAQAAGMAACGKADEGGSGSAG
jgi:hypothetical protein